MAKPKYKLDLFRLLEAADRRDAGFFARLSEEERKEFATNAYMIMRWLSAVVPDGSTSELYLLLSNELVNRNVWQLRDHPELLWLLMSRVGIGRKQRHKWIGAPKRRRADKINQFMMQWHPGANELELGILLNQFTETTFAEFVRSTGTPEDEAREIIAEYERVNGKAGATAA
jgi:hypothetical protein